MQQMDFKVKYKGYPYVAPPSVVIPSGATIVSPALASTASSVDQLSNFLANIVPQIPTSVGAQPPATTGGDQWTGIGLDTSKFDPIQKFLGFIGKTVDSLNKITVAITKVLSIMELFITGFNSFSSLISSAIALAKQTLEQYSVSGLGFGIYLNLIAPPAFLATKPGEAWIKLDRGGFEGFLTRLQNSINDPTDKNRPVFTPLDFVGGWVVLLDSESIDEIWSGLKQLAGMFDFVKLFGLNLLPPAPQNFKGSCSFFDANGNIDTKVTMDSNGNISPKEDKFGIKLEWDNGYMSSAYLISRSKTPGGVPFKEVPYVPSTLLDDSETGDPGLITLAKDMLMSAFNGIPVKLPTKLEPDYSDSDFNGGKPKLVTTSVGLTLSYIDYIDPKSIPERNQYFYVIQACDELGLTKGPYSLELAVTAKTCNDMINQSDAIQQPNGNFEFLSTGGIGRVGSWTSIKASAMVPWLKDLIGFISEDLLGALSGLTTSASESFSKFINEIKASIQLYINIINVISFILVSLKNFILGPQILMLNLKPVKGDMTTFVNRIRNAKLPAGDPGLSGSNGISIGFVVAYGASGDIAPSLGKAFDFITGLFANKK